MFVEASCDFPYRKGSKDSFHDTAIHDIAKAAERCSMGLEALYQQTTMSMEANFCATQKASFSQKGMEDHGSDADDEITDVSGECISSSDEFCDIPKGYYISSGTKPLSLVIRRCSIPTTENNSPLVLKRNSNVSSLFTKERESISDREVLNIEENVNDIPFQKHVTVTTNASPTSEESHFVLGSPASDGIVRNLQGVVLSPLQQNNHSLVTQEYKENVINVNDSHIKISVPHTVESDHLKYMAGSTLHSPYTLLEKYCNDVDGGIPVSQICSREVCHRLGNDCIGNRNQDFQCLLGSLKTVQSHSSNRCKQTVEMPNHSTFVDVLKEDLAGNVTITENEGNQEVYAVDTIRYESKTQTDVIMDSDLFHIRKELSESGETCNLKLQTQGESCAIGGISVVESSVVESLINEVCDRERVAIVNNSIKFQSDEALLLQVQRGNANELDNHTERGKEVNSAVNHDVKVTASGNVFEDHTAGKYKHEKTEVSVAGSEITMVTATDAVKSEKHVEIASEPLPLQNIDNTLQKIEMKLPENASVIIEMRNATVSVSPISVGCALYSTQAENSENSHLMICTQKEQTVSVDDSAVQKCVQASFYDVESTMNLNRQIPVIGIDDVITAESEKVRSLNIKAEDKTNMVHSPVLAGELTKNGVEIANSRRDRLYKVSRTDHVQSSVHNSPLLVQSCTEDTLDCYNDVPSGTVFVEHSPLLFSSDDENSYYTETVNNEQETSATTSNYDILTAEQKKLHQLQEALLGVPPPPSVTIPQLDVSDILRLLKENRSLMILADTKSETGAEAVKSPAAPLKPSSVEQIKNYSWLESKSCYQYGIQYNYGRISEEFEILCQKLQERYVGKETNSSCNIWFNCDISNKVSNVTSRHRSTGHSPGRRLSHLARRKRTFSCANLLNSNVADSRHSAAERRLIKVETKKAEHKQRFKNYQPNKQAPSVDCNRLQQTKRALFKSPPGNHKGVSSASKTRSGSKKNKSAIGQTRAENCKCSLWPSKDNAAVKRGCDRALTSLSGQMYVCGKRRREEGGMPLQKCPRRMLFSSAATAVKGESDFMTAGDSSHIRTRENKPQMSVAKDLTCGLSEVHRKKLLWAVAEALRGEGISMNHALFRPYATSLVQLVRKVMPDLNSKRSVSTSDLMLQLAKEHIKDVIKQQTGETKLKSRT